jgi:hypothetical protein
VTPTGSVVDRLKVAFEPTRRGGTDGFHASGALGGGGAAGGGAGTGDGAGALPSGEEASLPPPQPASVVIAAPRPHFSSRRLLSSGTLEFKPIPVEYARSAVRVWQCLAVHSRKHHQPASARSRPSPWCSLRAVVIGEAEPRFGLNSRPADQRGARFDACRRSEAAQQRVEATNLLTLSEFFTVTTRPNGLAADAHSCDASLVSGSVPKGTTGYARFLQIVSTSPAAARGRDPCATGPVVPR